MFVFFSIYTIPLPIITNYVNYKKGLNAVKSTFKPFSCDYRLIQVLYIINLTRFHTFSLSELLYLYSVFKRLKIDIN
jgi:hypothetical protein